MKVQALSTIEVLQNTELKTIFKKDKIYYTKKFNNLGYIVVNEFGKDNLYCDTAFKYNFKIIED